MFSGTTIRGSFARLAQRLTEQFFNGGNRSQVDLDSNNPEIEPRYPATDSDGRRV